MFKMISYYQLRGRIKYIKTQIDNIAYYVEYENHTEDEIYEMMGKRLEWIALVGELRGILISLEEF